MLVLSEPVHGDVEAGGAVAVGVDGVHRLQQCPFCQRRRRLRRRQQRTWWPVVRNNVSAALVSFHSSAKPDIPAMCQTETVSGIGVDYFLELSTDLPAGGSA